MTNIKIPTFLKWAGGKRRLINQIDKHFPKKINRYFEPFLGAGSIFFYIKQRYNPSFCMISDINKDLINTFKAIRNNPKKLIKKIDYFKRNNSKEFYYKTRKEFNELKIKGIKRCATFIYLNKTCFNGIYRVNSKGEFNVPYGKYKNPEIYDEKTILLAGKLLKGVKIVCQDYEKIIDRVKKEDFVYLDPCYDPLKRTSFTAYTPKRFCDEDNKKLAIFISKIKCFGGNVLLSNNVTSNVSRLYSQKDYKRIIVYCSRSINSKGDQRGKIPEYLIRSY